jgi:prephenate dehydrogenase
MTIQLTIIGLGQIGASIGLALASQKEVIRRVGHDKEPNVSKRARDLGVLDKVEFNLHAAVQGADLVLLTLPTDQIRETLELIAEDLKEGAVVMDTAPIKEIISTWAAELLPKNRYYIGLTPVLNPAYLHTTDSGLDAARADLFTKGLIAISAPSNTISDAVKMAADLTRLLGASPLFADPLEMDGLMAATHLLPQLLAAGLLNATLDQPGWREGRKVAGRPYAEATGPIVHLGSSQALAADVMLNRENVRRMLDSALAALMSIRSDIDAQDQDALEERLERARQGREQWWAQRQVGDWASNEMPPSEMPSASSIFGSLFGMKPKPKK